MATTDTTSDSLPVPAEQMRTYVRVRSATAQLDPETVIAYFRKLHQLRGPTLETRSFLDQFRSATPPTIEFLLVSRGGTDTPVEYYVGVDADDTVLEQTLRGLFPNTYELEVAKKPPHWLDELEDDGRTVTGVEFCGRPARPRDWQTQLVSFEEFHTVDGARVPLTAIIETMAHEDTTIVYQALLRPKPDWSGQVANRKARIEYGQDTIRDQVETVIFGPLEEGQIPPADRRRLEELEEKDAHRSFDCVARAVAIGDDEDTRLAVHELANTFTDISKTCYEIAPRIHETGTDLLAAISTREFRLSRRGLLRKHPLHVVVDATEAPNFCILDGSGLTTTGARALSPTPGEQTGLPTPPVEQLSSYRGEGLPLGLPLTDDNTPDPEPLVLPSSLQPLHVAWIGKTGAGKSTATVLAILLNHLATTGASIIIDRKGDGMAEEYMRIHYAKYGHVENILYFDCAKILPAFSFFDIRDQLDAGVSRTTAVEDTVDHYLEILMQIMGRDRFEQAVRSPDIIRYVTKAMFDPVNGQDAFSHRDLHTAVRRMHERQAAPPVSDDDLEQMLAGVVANRARSFDEIMQGVANRIEKIPIDQRLARIFNHSPEPGEPHFDLADYLDEDVVIIFDMGGLREEAQRVLTLVILSNLWTALRRRAQRSDDRGLVNLYIEEAAGIAVSDLLKQLLSQSRSFDCSVTLSMQFPAQLKALDQSVYEELLNNISTFITGNVAVDPLLAQRLATDDMDATQVGNRLRALRRGQWLVSLPAGFGEPEPRPFLVESLPLPPGHPDGDQPLSAYDELVFTAALDAVAERTLETAGLTLDLPQATLHDDLPEEQPLYRVDSALPYTRRLPPTVEYDADLHALRCSRCDTRYNPNTDGMTRAISCCSSLDDVDPDDIPICDVNLKLTKEERAVSDWSDTQLLFLQAVYNAQQRRYSPPEYDLLHDSMIRLQEYTGIEPDELQDLLDSDLLRHDTDHPHRLYTVTPDGRHAIGESYREGVDYGHGKGDLEESSEHVLGVEIARQYLVQEYLDNLDSPVVDVVPYYDLDENHRLDLAGLDADGEFVVTVEIERINHDVRRAVPEDYDKMAACEPDEAIWVVMSRAGGHDVLHALNDPLEGPVRVEKTYAKTTPLHNFRIDTPGLTAIHTAEWLRAQLET